MNIKIFIICVLLCGCATMPIIKDDYVKPQTEKQTWCSTCSNKGWIPCDLCWNGKTLDGRTCWKCKGIGKVHCSTCFGQCNPNSEWK